MSGINDDVTAHTAKILRMILPTAEHASYTKGTEKAPFKITDGRRLELSCPTAHRESREHCSQIQPFYGEVLPVAETFLNYPS